MQNYKKNTIFTIILILFTIIFFINSEKVSATTIRSGFTNNMNKFKISLPLVYFSDYYLLIQECESIISFDLYYSLDDLYGIDNHDIEICLNFKQNIAGDHYNSIYYFDINVGFNTFFSSIQDEQPELKNNSYITLDFLFDTGFFSFYFSGGASLWNNWDDEYQLFLSSSTGLTLKLFNLISIDGNIEYSNLIIESGSVYIADKYDIAFLGTSFSYNEMISCRLSAEIFLLNFEIFYKMDIYIKGEYDNKMFDRMLYENIKVLAGYQVYEPWTGSNIKAECGLIYIFNNELIHDLTGRYFYFNINLNFYF